MKNLFLLSAFCFLLLPSFSQPVFNKVLTSERNMIAFGIEKIDNHYYYIATDRSPEFNSTSRIYKTDLQGNRIDSLRFVDPLDLVTYGGLIARNDSLYFFANGNILDTIYLSLVCMTKDLEIVWEKEIAKEEFNSDAVSYYNPKTIIATHDGGWLFSYERTINEGNYFVKTDAQGNQEWKRGISSSAMFLNILELDNGDLICSGYHKVNNWASEWAIIKLNALGQELGSLVFDEPADLELTHGQVFKIIQTQDGNFIAVGGNTYAEGCGELWQDARLLKFDIDFNILKDTLFSVPFINPYQCEESDRYARFEDIELLPNGNYLLWVAYHPLKYDSYQYSEMLYEMSPNFEIIKKRELFSSEGCSGANRYIEDYIVEDDGIVMMGWVWHDACANYVVGTPMQSPWMLKVDWDLCDGYASCDTAIHLEYIPDVDTVFKNVEYFQSFKLTDGLNDTIKYNFRIFVTNATDYHYDNFYDYLNVSMDSVFNLDLSYETHNYDSLYLQIMYVSSDTLTVPQRWADLKKIYFIENDEGIDEINSKSSFSIYPNPATNNVQIIINNEQLKNKAGKIKIYDIRAKLVKEFKIQNSKFIIQIGDLEKGIYFVQIGTGTQKLIIE